MQEVPNPDKPNPEQRPPKKKITFAQYRDRMKQIPTGDSSENVQNPIGDLSKDLDHKRSRIGESVNDLKNEAYNVINRSVEVAKPIPLFLENLYLSAIAAYKEEPNSLERVRQLQLAAVEVAEFALAKVENKDFHKEINPFVERIKGSQDNGKESQRFNLYQQLVGVYGKRIEFIQAFLEGMPEANTSGKEKEMLSLAKESTILMKDMTDACFLFKKDYSRCSSEQGTGQPVQEGQVNYPLGDAFKYDFNEALENYYALKASNRLKEFSNIIENLKSVHLYYSTLMATENPNLDPKEREAMIEQYRKQREDQARMQETGHAPKDKGKSKEQAIPEEVQSAEAQEMAEPYSPENFIATLKQDPDLKRRYEGDAGQYTVEAHTTMVLRQFEKYFAENWDSERQWVHGSAPLTKKQFRLMLALHDIGKSQAFEETRNTSTQHQHTSRVAKQVLARLKIPEEKANIIRSIAVQDYIGEYMKRRISPQEAAKYISDEAAALGIETKDYFEVLRIYYMSDAGSYTKDADPRGVGILDSFFEFREDPNGKKTMQFSRSKQGEFQKLADLIN